MTDNEKGFVTLQARLGDAPSLAKFSECIVQQFCPQHTETTVVFNDGEGSYLLQSAANSKSALKLAHASFCPMLHSTAKQRNEFMKNAPSGKVPLAVSTVVQTSDKCILLTRRAKTLRAFPGVWVTPGGYTEKGETSEEAGLRELFEEVGIDAKSLGAHTKPLCLYESVYPVMLGHGLPKRHTLVLYVLVSLKQSSKELETFKVSEDEVDMICWLSEKAIRKILEESAQKSSKRLKVFESHGKGQLVQSSHKLAKMAQILPITHDGMPTDLERAGGTWLAMDNQGKTAVILNINKQKHGDFKSRGKLIVEWLKSGKTALEFATRLAEERDIYDGYSLILIDRLEKLLQEKTAAAGKNSIVYYSNVSKDGKPEILSPGIGLSNSPIGKPYLKVQYGLEQFYDVLVKNHVASDFGRESLIDDCLELLNDKTSHFPDTVLKEMEPDFSKYMLKCFSSCFVEAPRASRPCGTRSQTIMLIDGANKATFMEHSMIDLPDNICEAIWDTKRFDFEL